MRLVFLCGLASLLGGCGGGHSSADGGAAPSLDAGTKSDSLPVPAGVDVGTADEPAADRPPMVVDAARTAADAPLASSSWWHPTVGMTWDWQLMSPVNQMANVQVYDIDLFDNDAQVIGQLHASGRKVICYVDVGSWEDWRPDAAQFPRSVIGAKYAGFPHENWLDVRKIDELAPVLRARFDMARNKACDGIEPDNVDGFNTETHASSGFPIAYADQLAFNRWVAAEAHLRGLAVAHKNNLTQIKDLVDQFDMAVSEQCFQYQECDNLVPFITAGKPVFETEYELSTTEFCDQARQLRFSSILKKPALDSFRQGCP